MPQAKSEKQIRSFIKGLITEAGPLSFPEDASLDEDNFVLERTGLRSRRLGVDYESGYALTDTGLSASLIEGTKVSFHKWPSPDGDTTVSIGVIRVYNKLWFLNMLATSPSASLLNGGSAITISGLSNANIDSSVINNYLILVSSDLSKPIKLTYDKTAKTVSQEQITINVRDLWGINDSLAIDERPATLSNSHKYNLRNQGWSSKIVSTCGTDAIDCTFTTLAKYPANADIWSLGKVGDAASANFEKYDPNVLQRNSIDNAPASQGSYILDAFMRGSSRATLSGLSGLPTDIESGTITTIASFSDRVFYSGIVSTITGGDSKSPNYSGYIFFSQNALSTDKFGKCYQEADPSSENISDIIDTDGGTIHIAEATRIVKLMATKSSLLVFAENGVWEIFGDTAGFIATSFQISKVSSVGITNPKTVVETNGVVVYWATAGIYALTQNPTSGRYGAESLSLTTIQEFYNDMSTTAKNNARGIYNEKENKIRWLFNSATTYSETSYVNKYNRELILDLTLKSFYPQTIESLVTGSPYIADYIEVPGYTNLSANEDIYVSNDPVVITSLDNVVITNNSISSRKSQVGFLTINSTSFTISSYNNSTFYDWKTADGTGISFSSFLVTGYDGFGDILRKKQTPYILFYFEKTEDGFSTVDGNLVLDNQSSCNVQAQWNWADSAASGKWGTVFQAYKFNRNYIPSGAADTFDYGDSVIVTKNKLRGSGRALSLKITSEVGKDMKLLGWGFPVTGTGTV